MECRSVHIQKDTADITGALTVQINSGSYVNGIHIQLYFCSLYINITPKFAKNQEHTCGFFAIFSCEFSLYSLGYDYKTPVIGMIVAGGQRKQLVPIFHGGAGIIDRRYFDPSDILFKNLLGSQVVI